LEEAVVAKKNFQIIGIVTMIGIIAVSQMWAGGTNQVGPSGGGVETVRVWTNDGAYEPYIRPYVDAYNQGEGKAKGIFIDYKIFGSDYHDVLNVALSANQGPEIFKFVGTVKEPYINSGWMVPIDDMPGGPEMLEKNKNILVNGYSTFNGKSYSIPVKVLTTKLMYNKDILVRSGFNNPPETWDQMADMAKKITADNKNEVYGYGMHLKDAASSGKWYFAVQFATSAGHIGYNFATGKYQFIDFLPNMRAILRMKAEGSIFPGAEGLDGEGLMAQFAIGRVAMVNGVCWDVSNIDSFWKELGSKFNLGIADTPVVNSVRKFRNYAQSSDLLCLGASSLRMKEKSMEVYKVLHSDDLLVTIQNNEVDFISREDIQAKAPAAYKKMGTAEFADTSNSYFTLTPPDGAIAIEGQPYQNTLINIAAGPANADVAAILADLDKRYNVAMEKAVSEGFDQSSYIDPTWNSRVSR
jgi:multiple sugar transport system substrate-binding protein